MSDLNSWLAGAASVKFTPDEPLWLAGYAARTEPARGTHSDLHATALALRDARGTVLVIASVDIIAIPASLADEAARLVRQAFPDVPRENFVFCATHTHYGPEVRPDKVLFFKIPPEYGRKIGPTAARVARAAADAMIRALSEMRPATLTAHHGRATFAHNRRGAAVTDHDVPILAVRSARRTLRSVLFGYACHNTCMDPQDRLYSSDWAGRARRRIETRHPGCTGVFVTGCGADQNPDPRGTQALSDEYGDQLASAVEVALASPGAELPPVLRVAAGTADLDMVPVTAASLAEALTSNDPPRRVKAQHLADRLARGETLETSYAGPMQVVGLGGDKLLLIAMSGETVVDWSHKFKTDFAGRYGMVWTAGYCNDMYGYIPTLRVQREGGYEGGRANLWSWVPSPWTETVEDRVSQTIHKLVEQITQ